MFVAATNVKKIKVVLGFIRFSKTVFGNFINRQIYRIVIITQVLIVIMKNISYKSVKFYNRKVTKIIPVAIVMAK